MASQMIIRMPDDLKLKVNKLAQAEGKNVSTVVRELLEEYVRNRDISSYIDDLWDRIGNTLKTEGRTPEDIKAAISQVRAKK